MSASHRPLLYAEEAAVLDVETLPEEVVIDGDLTATFKPIVQNSSSKKDKEKKSRRKSAAREHSARQSTENVNEPESSAEVKREEKKKSRRKSTTASEKSARSAHQSTRNVNDSESPVEKEDEAKRKKNRRKSAGASEHSTQSDRQSSVNVDKYEILAEEDAESKVKKKKSRRKSEAASEHSTRSRRQSSVHMNSLDDQDDVMDAMDDFKATLLGRSRARTRLPAFDKPTDCDTDGAIKYDMDKNEKKWLDVDLGADTSTWVPNGHQFLYNQDYLKSSNLEYNAVGASNSTVFLSELSPEYEVVINGNIEDQITVNVQASNEDGLDINQIALQRAKAARAKQPHRTDSLSGDDQSSVGSENSEESSVSGYKKKKGNARSQFISPSIMPKEDEGYNYAFVAKSADAVTSNMLRSIYGNVSNGLLDTQLDNALNAAVKDGRIRLKHSTVRPKNPSQEKEEEEGRKSSAQQTSPAVNYSMETEKYDIPRPRPKPRSAGDIRAVTDEDGPKMLIDIPLQYGNMLNGQLENQLVNAAKPTVIDGRVFVQRKLTIPLGEESNSAARLSASVIDYSIGTEKYYISRPTSSKSRSAGDIRAVIEMDGSMMLTEVLPHYENMLNGQLDEQLEKAVNSIVVDGRMIVQRINTLKNILPGNESSPSVQQSGSISNANGSQMLKPGQKKKKGKPRPPPAVDTGTEVENSMLLFDLCPEYENMLNEKLDQQLESALNAASKSGYAVKPKRNTKKSLRSENSSMSPSQDVVPSLTANESENSRHSSRRTKVTSQNSKTSASKAQSSDEEYTAIMATKSTIYLHQDYEKVYGKQFDGQIEDSLRETESKSIDMNQVAEQRSRATNARTEAKRTSRVQSNTAISGNRRLQSVSEKSHYSSKNEVLNSAQTNSNITLAEVRPDYARVINGLLDEQLKNALNATVVDGRIVIQSSEKVGGSSKSISCFPSILLSKTVAEDNQSKVETLPKPRKKKRKPRPLLSHQSSHQSIDKSVLAVNSTELDELHEDYNQVLLGNLETQIQNCLISEDDGDINLDRVVARLARDKTNAAAQVAPAEEKLEDHPTDNVPDSDLQKSQTYSQPQDAFERIIADKSEFALNNTKLMAELHPEYNQVLTGRLDRQIENALLHISDDEEINPEQIAAQRKLSIKQKTALLLKKALAEGNRVPEENRQNLPAEASDSTAKKKKKKPKPPGATSLLLVDKSAFAINNTRLMAELHPEYGQGMAGRLEEQIENALSISNEEEINMDQIVAKRAQATKAKLEPPKVEKKLITKETSFSESTTEMSKPPKKPKKKSKRLPDDYNDQFAGKSIFDISNTKIMTELHPEYGQILTGQLDTQIANALHTSDDENLNMDQITTLRAKTVKENKPVKIYNAYYESMESPSDYREHESEEVSKNGNFSSNQIILHQSDVEEFNPGTNAHATSQNRRKKKLKKPIPAQSDCPQDKQNADLSFIAIDKQLLAELSPSYGHVFNGQLDKQIKSMIGTPEDSAVIDIEGVRTLYKNERSKFEHRASASTASAEKVLSDPEKPIKKSRKSTSVPSSSSSNAGIPAASLNDANQGQKSKNEWDIAGIDDDNRQKLKSDLSTFVKGAKNYKTPRTTTIMQPNADIAVDPIAIRAINLVITPWVDEVPAKKPRKSIRATPETTPVTVPAEASSTDEYEEEESTLELGRALLKEESDKAEVPPTPPRKSRSNLLSYVKSVKDEVFSPQKAPQMTVKTPPNADITVDPIALSAINHVITPQVSIIPVKKPRKSIIATLAAPPAALVTEVPRTDSHEEEESTLELGRALLEEESEETEVHSTSPRKSRSDLPSYVKSAKEEVLEQKKATGIGSMLVSNAKVMGNLNTRSSVGNRNASHVAEISILKTPKSIPVPSSQPSITAVTEASTSYVYEEEESTFELGRALLEEDLGKNGAHPSPPQSDFLAHLNVSKDIQTDLPKSEPPVSEGLPKNSKTLSIPKVQTITGESKTSKNLSSVDNDDKSPINIKKKLMVERFLQRLEENHQAPESGVVIELVNLQMSHKNTVEKAIPVKKSINWEVEKQHENHNVSIKSAFNIPTTSISSAKAIEPKKNPVKEIPTSRKVTFSSTNQTSDAAQTDPPSKIKSEPPEKAVDVTLKSSIKEIKSKLIREVLGHENVDSREVRSKPLENEKTLTEPLNILLEFKKQSVPVQISLIKECKERRPRLELITTAMKLENRFPLNPTLVDVLKQSIAKSSAYIGVMNCKSRDSFDEQVFSGMLSYFLKNESGASCCFSKSTRVSLIPQSKGLWIEKFLEDQEKKKIPKTQEEFFWVLIQNDQQ